jgi:hypothetical protein
MSLGRIWGSHVTSMKMAVFWVVAPCSLVEVYRRFRGASCLHHQGNVIGMTRENHVSLMCLPLHSTHRIQPLDVALMRHFKTYYTQGIGTWLRNHPGCTVTHCKISGLMGKAELWADFTETALNHFRKICFFYEQTCSGITKEKTPFRRKNLQHFSLIQASLTNHQQQLFVRKSSASSLHLRTHRKQFQESHDAEHHFL